MNIAIRLIGKERLKKVHSTISWIVFTALQSIDIDESLIHSAFEY